MDRSSASDPSQKENTQHSSTRIRVKKTPSTPRPEVVAPLMSHVTAPLTVSTPQPPEMSTSEAYLTIIRDTLGKFSPAGKMSNLLTQMADEIRKEEANLDPIPFGIPTYATTPIETTGAQALVEQTTLQNPSPAMDLARNDEIQEDEAEYEVEMEKGEEGNSQGEGEVGAEEEEVEGQGNEEGENKEKLVERNFIDMEREVVVLEEKGSSENGETLDEMALRRNLRTRRRLETTEHRGALEEATAIATAERQAAERKRNEK